MLRPAAVNPATKPVLTESVIAGVSVKTGDVLALLKSAVAEFGSGHEVTFANSMGAEDMVLTDLILRENLPIEIFSLDTGRLPAETYDLISQVEKTYNTRLKIMFPLADTVENYVR